MDFQRELAAANIEIPIIFITAHGDIPMTVQAMKAGAVDSPYQALSRPGPLDLLFYQAVGRDRRCVRKKGKSPAAPPF